MNRTDVNKEYDCKIPATFDIGQHVSGYISMRNDKRQAHSKQQLQGFVKPLSEDAFEVFLKTILTYAKDMPGSPLMITDHQAVHLIKKLKIYKNWSIDRRAWDLHSDIDDILPSLSLNGREIVIEESSKPEQKSLFG